MTTHDPDAPVGSVSVVVPTYNRLDRLQRVLAALAAQDVDVPMEVVVISDGSTDGTNEYLHGDDPPLPITAVVQDNGGPSVARNHGVERATGDLLVFIDDDVIVEPGTVAAHVAAHRRLGDRTVVIGPMLDPTDAELSPWVAWEQAQLAKQYDAMLRGAYEATCRQFYTGNASVLRRHFVELGGFDTSFRRAEDVELAFRMEDAGLVFHFEPEAVGRHYAERTYESWRAIARAYGRNDVVFAREHGRGWVEDMIVENFQERPAPAQRVIASAIRWPAVGHATLALAEAVVKVSGRFGPERLVQGALSTIYAIEFGSGVADQLGSRSEYLELVRAG